MCSDNTAQLDNSKLLYFYEMMMVVVTLSPTSACQDKIGSKLDFSTTHYLQTLSLSP